MELRKETFKIYLLINCSIFIILLSGCTKVATGLMENAKPNMIESLSGEHGTEQIKEFRKAYDQFLEVSNDIGISNFMNAHGEIYHGLRTITSDKTISVKESTWWCELVNNSLEYFSLSDLQMDSESANYQLLFGQSISPEDPHISEYKDEIPEGYGSVKFQKINGLLDVLKFEICLYEINNEKSKKIFTDLNVLESPVRAFYQSFEFTKKGEYVVVVKLPNSDKVFAKRRFNITN